ncbi:MAG: class I SAM-dependent methyltransferase [Gemmatimonadota bacterium]
MKGPRFDTRELARLYREGKNLSRHMREVEGSNENSTANVLYSYDLQAGSYTAFLDDPEFRVFKEEQGRRLAALLDETPGATILDAGTGEGTTLAPILRRLSTPPPGVLAFDISLSRLLYAQLNLREMVESAQVDPRLFVGALESIPLLDNSVDVVVTCHALEPNGGREREILSELVRVARRRLILVEPAWELGSEATRARIQEHGYVKGIPETLDALGHPAGRHELWGWNERPENEAALTVVELEGPTSKEAGRAHGAWPPYASPVSGATLEDRGDAWYSVDDGYAFPVIQGIPCLLSQYAVLATRLGEFPVQGK